MIQFEEATSDSDDAEAEMTIPEDDDDDDGEVEMEEDNEERGEARGGDEYEAFPFEDMLVGDYAVVEARAGGRDPYAFRVTLEKHLPSPWLLLAKVTDKCSNGKVLGCIPSTGDQINWKVFMPKAKAWVDKKRRLVSKDTVAHPKAGFSSKKCWDGWSMFEREGASQSGSFDSSEGVICDRDIYHSWRPEGDVDQCVIKSQQYKELISNIRAIVA